MAEAVEVGERIYITLLELDAERSIGSLPLQGLVGSPIGVWCVRDANGLERDGHLLTSGEDISKYAGYGLFVRSQSAPAEACTPKT